MRIVVIHGFRSPQLFTWTFSSGPSPQNGNPEGKIDNIGPTSYYWGKV